MNTIDLSTLSPDQKADCLDWLNSDNVVIERGKTGNIYRAQCNQYMSRMTIGEAIYYWNHEYGKYQSY